MIVAIAASSQQQLALEKKGFNKNTTVIWVDTSLELYHQNGADIWIDCLFNGTKLNPYSKPLLIHSPLYTLQELKAAPNVARFCAWDGLLERAVWEMAVQNEKESIWLNELMQNLGWHFKYVKDVPGLIAPRVIATIINEAYFTYEEGISSKKDIDIAMKLGTNYPYGPFEWAEKIGMNHIYLLLQQLSQTDKRYQPSMLIQVDIIL